MTKELWVKSSLLIIFKFIISGLSFVFYYLLATSLTVTEFGLFSLLLSIVLLGSVLAKQGLEQTVTRFIAQSNNNAVYSIYIYAIKRILLITLILALLVVVVGTHLISSLMSQPKLADVIWFAILLIGLQSLIAINSSALKGLERPTRSLLLTGGLTFTFAIIMLIIVDISSAWQALVILSVATSGACLISFLLVMDAKKKRCEDNAGSSDLLDVSASLKKVSRRLFVISLAAMVTQQLGTIVLAKYESLAVVGQFSLALKVSMLLSYPILVINALTASKYAKLFQQDRIVALKKLALDINKVLFVLATALVITMLLATNIITRVFGEEYSLSIDLIKVLIIGQWFNLATGTVVSLLVMAGFEKVHRRNTLVITAFVVLSMVLLTPIYGVWAIAWITSIAMAVKNIVSFLAVNKYIYSKAIN